MSIQNTGISSNLFQTMALLELAQATSALNTQEGTGTAGVGSADCTATNQGSEAQAVLSALEGNLPIGQTQQNYNSNEMDQLLAMETLLAQEQAQASSIGNNYANCMPNNANYDNGYNNGYGYNSGYNSYAEPANNAIQNELQIGNEALLLAMLQQDSQSNGTSTSNTSAQPNYNTNPTRSGNCQSNTGMNANYTSNNSSSNYLNNSAQETSYWSAGSTTVPWLSESGATPTASFNPGGINRVY